MNRQFIKARSFAPPQLIKIYAYQLLAGLAYIHSKQICHRDIKPHNVLVDPRTNRVLICDFGSAKRLVPGESNIAYICSRSYRAPELIFDFTQYSVAVDIWSAGCVIAELVNGEPLFLGDNSIDQLVEIIKVLGTPSKVDVVKLKPGYNLSDYNFPAIKKKDWKKVLRKTDPLLADLIAKLLVYAPEERLTAQQALQHRFFDELKREASLRELGTKFAVPSCLGQLDQDTAETSKSLTPVRQR